MSRIDVAKASRMELRATDDDRIGGRRGDGVHGLGMQQFARARNTRRIGAMRNPVTTEVVESLVETTPELPVQADVTSSNKLQQLHSSLHQVSKVTAKVREGLKPKSPEAPLTRENLRHLEEIYETNRPAVNLKRKEEFIRKQFQRGRHSVASMDQRNELLRMIDEREEKSETDRKIRADSVLGDLRKAKFRHLAHLAQKRLQSVSPDVQKMEEDREALASGIDWYLRFCGEEVPKQPPYKSRSPV